jgi:hypothetical protein
MTNTPAYCSKELITIRKIFIVEAPVFINVSVSSFKNKKNVQDEIFLSPARVIVAIWRDGCQPKVNFQERLTPTKVSWRVFETRLTKSSMATT